MTGLLLYALQEPERLVQAASTQLTWDLDEAMTLYAQNCAVCHGLSGEGIGATPPLDAQALQESDAPSLAKTIARGLYGTAMPAWSLEDGGSLNDYQVSQLVALIQDGDWQTVQKRVVNLGLAPLVPFTSEADPAILADLQALPGGEQLAQGVALFASQCVACHGADGLGSAIAPAINDPLVRQKTAQEIERTISLGTPGTLMAGWEKTLSADEVGALVALVTRWGEVPAGAIPAPDMPVPVTTKSLALGAELYAANCSSCHAPQGQGSQRAPSLNVKAFLADTQDMAIQQIITLGVPSTAMQAWGDRMTEAEIQAIVGYLRSWEPTAPEVAVAQRGRGRSLVVDQQQPAQRAVPAQRRAARSGERTGRPAEREEVLVRPEVLLPARWWVQIPLCSRHLKLAGVCPAKPPLLHQLPRRLLASGQVGTPAAAGHARAGKRGVRRARRLAAAHPGRARQHRQMKVFHSTGWSKTGGRVVSVFFAGLLVGVTLVGGAAVGLRRLR